MDNFFQMSLVNVNDTAVKMNHSNERVISLAGFHQGIYFLKMVTDAGQLSFRIAVIR